MDVRVHQQQGETHVMVRAAEQTTRLALRQDLPHLVTALDHAGFRAETFTPQAADERALAEETVSAGTPFGAAAGDPSRQEPSAAGQKDFPGFSGGREPEHQQHRQRQHMHDYWLDQMEA